MDGPRGQHCDSMTVAVMCLKFRVMIRELRSRKVLRGQDVSERTESTKGMLETRFSDLK